MANTAHSFGKYRDEYVRFISTLQVKPQWKPSIERLAKSLYQHKDRYLEVEETTGVPWKVIAVIHQLECGARFDLHLHNGDPLTRRTRRVPRGYPKAAPASGSVYTWEESAHDALVNRMKMNEVSDWSDAGIAFQLEKYNGFGYRSKGVPSPYLWSGSNHYSRGKYVADGRWDSSHVSQQAGAMLLYVQLRDLEATAPVPQESSGDAGKAPVEKKDDSNFWHQIRDFIRWVGIGITGWLTADTWVLSKDIINTLGGLFTKWGWVLLVAGLVIWAFTEWYAKREKADVAKTPN